MRKVVLDTETTGMHFGKPIYQDHYIIEIGAIELIERTPRNTFQRYIRAPRESTPESLAVHGLTWNFLQNAPAFAEIVQELVEFIKGAELIIHNAPFDLAFLNAEFSRTAALGGQTPYKVEELCPVITDTLQMARKQFPNRKNSLDVLCERLGISNAHRLKHGALLDSELLLQVYLALTGGQKSFSFCSEPRSKKNEEGGKAHEAASIPEAFDATQSSFPLPASTHSVAYASEKELEEHEACLKAIALLVVKTEASPNAESISSAQEFIADSNEDRAASDAKPL